MKQGARDYCMRLIRELINGIDAGDFSQPIISDKYKWEHLLGLFLMKDELDGGEKLFRELYDLATRSGEEYLRQKSHRGEKIKVTFQSYSAAQWPAGEVYRKFDKMPNINVNILVSPLVDRDNESTIDTYSQTRQWFLEHDYNIIDGLDLNSMESSGWENLGGFPDVLYQLSSWYGCLPIQQWFTQLPLRCLVAYIPYGMDVSDSSDGSYLINYIYNKDIVNLTWRVYAETQFTLDGYKKYQMLEGKNARYSGYSKMDYFYHEHVFDEKMLKSIWKIPEQVNVNTMKKIIIAPHYTILSKGDLCYSTFQKNLWFWIYLIKKYSDKISFIFKPHPNLRRTAVCTGLFGSYEAYDEYIKTWNDNANAKVVQEGDYLACFASSDAMIMDSASFIGEYLYTGKPLLYLIRPEQTFNAVGAKTLSAYYQAPGEDYMAIEEFIEDVVIGGNDPMADARKKIFEEEYDYVKINGQKASDYIVNEILELIGQ
ncbi:MAG: CDP-glycerol glycerophosphotransferase family protein [Butyrivibrio sp.]|nr:CDP-glycerol glycerophosphotransferase family protein [Butyrivibrio sp.]